MKRIVTLALMMLLGGYEVAQAQTPMEMETATERQTAARDFLGLKWGLGIGVMGGFGGDKAIEKASIVGTEKKTVYVEEEGDLRPQAFLEMHVFLGGSKVREWRKYQREKAAYEMDMTRLKANERQTREEKAAKTAQEQAQVKQSGEKEAGEGSEMKKEEKARGGPAPEDWPSWPSMPKELPEMGFGPFIAVQSGDNKVIDALAVGVMWGFRRIPSESVSMNIGFGVSFDPSVQVLAKDFKEGDEPPNNETEVRFKKESQFGWSLMASFTF
jgi:hypothetical protein